MPVAIALVPASASLANSELTGEPDGIAQAVSHNPDGQAGAKASACIVGSDRYPRIIHAFVLMAAF